MWRQSIKLKPLLVLHEKSEKMMIDAAIFGLGRWGKNLVRSVQGKSTKIQFKYGVVQYPEKYDDFAQEADFNVTADAQAVLADPQISAIILATPHILHVEQIIAAAKAGKAVFCEKPLALTSAQALKAVQACDLANVQLGVGHDKRFWPSMQELKRLANSGVLGDLTHVEGNFTNENLTNFKASWRDHAENIPGGSLTATGIHIVDACVNLLGPIKSVQGIYRQLNGGAQDSMVALFDFNSGATGILSSPRPSPVFWRVHLFGSKGSAEARGQNTVLLSLSGKPEEVFQFETINALQFQLEAFADAIVNKQPYIISPQEILNTVAAFEATAKAVDTSTLVLL